MISDSLFLFPFANRITHLFYHNYPMLQRIEVIKMNKTYDIQDLYKVVSQKLRQDNERISFECHKGGYKSIHKKMYSYIIVRTVLRAFFQVITEILAEGDTVRCFGYFKIEPKLYQARKVKNLYDNVLCDAPAQYKPKIKFGKQIKEACANIPVEKMENSSNTDKITIPEDNE